MLISSEDINIIQTKMKFFYSNSICSCPFQVTVYNRLDCCKERLDDFVVTVLDTNKQEVGECGRGGTMAGKDVEVVQCRLQGRFVQVSVEDESRILSLAEVEVVGSEIGEQFLLIVCCFNGIKFNAYTVI